jgi:hypothetical protein
MDIVNVLDLKYTYNAIQGAPSLLCHSFWMVMQRQSHLFPKQEKITNSTFCDVVHTFHDVAHTFRDVHTSHDVAHTFCDVHAFRDVHTSHDVAHTSHDVAHTFCDVHTSHILHSAMLYTHFTFRDVVHTFYRSVLHLQNVTWLHTNKTA